MTDSVERSMTDPVERSMTDKDSQKHRSGRVERWINTARDSLPGERDDLPEGARGGVPTEPQGDENRDPPPNAPIIPT